MVRLVYNVNLRKYGGMKPREGRLDAGSRIINRFMNYESIYNQLIERARDRLPEGYIERHHVIPSCMGGSDDKSNLVALYPEEHFVAHALLLKIYKHTEHRFALAKAVNKMCRGHRGRRFRRLYGWLKREHSLAMSESQKGEGNSQFGSFWISNGQESKKHRGEIPEGWFRGRNREKPIKKSQSSFGSRWINNGKESKILYPKQEIPDGWIYGRIHFNLHP